jgi:hypothetical protein
MAVCKDLACRGKLPLLNSFWDGRPGQRAFEYQVCGLMKTPIPDFNWYASQSAKTKLSPRCPIAKAELCPRYYASRWLLGENRITTKIPHEDKARLDKKWKPFTSVVCEEEPSISHADEKLSDISNFCPEVSYDTFHIFASYLSWHTDEIDSGFAQEKLATEGVDTSDPRWYYRFFTARHYTECREYSIFLEITSGRNKGKSSRIGLSAKVRWQVLARDSFTCKYCGRRAGTDVCLEVDHKIPVAKGGTNEIENLFAACLDCNRGKGSENLPAE